MSLFESKRSHISTISLITVYSCIHDIRTFIRHSAEQKNEQRQRQTDNILHKTTKIYVKLHINTEIHSTLREKRII